MRLNLKMLFLICNIHISCKNSIIPIVLLSVVIGATTFMRRKLENIINNKQPISALPNISEPEKPKTETVPNSNPQPGPEKPKPKPEPEKQKPEPKPEPEKQKPKLVPATKSIFLNQPKPISPNVDWDNINWNDIIKPGMTQTYESFKEYLQTITSSNFNQLMTKINGFNNKKNITTNDNLIDEYYNTIQNDFNKIVYTISFIFKKNKFESIKEVFALIS